MPVTPTPAPSPASTRPPAAPLLDRARAISAPLPVTLSVTPPGTPKASTHVFTATRASVLLDLVRGLAALDVLISHWRNRFFLPFPEVHTHRALLAPFYLLTSGAHLAVIVFFVLSGYLIAGSVYRAVQQNRWSWASYLLHRLTRLLTVLIPCLILGALWDTLGVHSHLAPGLYAGIASTGRFTLRAFLGNLAFLQELYVPTFGSNGALWSLANEFWYYLLFPLGLFALLPRTRLAPRLACLALFALAAAVAHSVLIYFPVWLAGALLAWFPLPRLQSWVRRTAALVYVVAFFTLTRVHFAAEDLVFTVLTFALLYTLLSASEPFRPSTGERSIRTLSRFSYTLYLAHTPLIVLLSALLLGDASWAPTPAHLLAGTGVLLLVTAYSYALASLTEFRTDRLRHALERRLGMRVDHSQAVSRT